MALETLASVLRSDQLAWRVIAGLKLYQQEASAAVLQRFPGFNPTTCSGAEAGLSSASHHACTSRPCAHILIESFPHPRRRIVAAVVNALSAYQGRRPNRRSRHAQHRLANASLQIESPRRS